MTGDASPAAAILAIGDPSVLAGYAMAGVRVVPAQTGPEVAAAWDGLDDDVALVLLTADAAAALGDHAGLDGPLRAVVPAMGEREEDAGECARRAGGADTP